jgi:hypothetical protein
MEAFEVLQAAAIADPITFWGTLANGLTASFALIAVIVSIVAFQRQIASEHYGEIDKLYFDLQHILIARPTLCRCTRGPDGDFEDGYDAFAFMMINFLETIMDRCSGRAHLQRSWQPILEVETANHLEWLNDPHNQRKFKREFLVFISKGGFHRYTRNRDLVDRIRRDLALV